MYNRTHTYSSPRRPPSAKARDERRKRFPMGVFAPEIAALGNALNGENRGSEILYMLGKGSPADREWAEAVRHAVEHIEIVSGDLHEAPVRKLDSAEGRGLLCYLLTVLGALERGEGARKDELRVDGPAGYWGRTEEPAAYRRTRTRPALTDEERAEGLSSPPAGDPRPHATRRTRHRRYCPKGKAGGLAERLGVTVRTIGNYARWSRLAGLLGSQQPGRDADDAVRSRRQGDYPYAVWRPLRALPSKMLQRLRIAWGELVTASRDVARAVVGEIERETLNAEIAARELVRTPRRDRGS